MLTSGSRPLRAAALVSTARLRVRYASRLPTTIRPNHQELSNKRLDSRNLEKAVHALHTDGLVVIADVIHHDQLDHLNTKMVEDALAFTVQQDAPPIKDYFHESIFLNPFASQVTTSIMGPKPKWTFCSGNTAMPPLAGAKSQRQPVHADADFAHPPRPFALVVNVPLIDFTPDNGSTETWLGTHTGELSGLHVQEGLHGERASGRIKEHLLENRRVARGPSQPEISKGSIVIRDLRLWHAGMPNWTEQIRVMLAMIHFAPWYRNPMKLELSDAVRPMVEAQQDLEVPVTWVSDKDAEAKYLNRGFGNSYDFGQTE